MSDDKKCVCGIGEGKIGHRDWCPCYAKGVDDPPMSEEAMAAYREEVANRPEVKVDYARRPLCKHGKDMKDVCHDCIKEKA
jgi:hypothetical protein